MILISIVFGLLSFEIKDFYTNGGYDNKIARNLLNINILVVVFFGLFLNRSQISQILFREENVNNEASFHPLFQPTPTPSTKMRSVSKRKNRFTEFLSE
jgi:hypothetical protein